MKHTVDDVIEIRNELISVKQTVPHGQFRPWLYCEFGWKKGSAPNYTNVAKRLKSASAADLELDLSAAHRLANGRRLPVPYCF